MSHCTWEAGTFAKAGKHSPNFVLFEVENEFELISITEYLCDHIIDYSAFRESWLGGEFTSICTEPLTCSNKRALFKEFKMYGK